jgi:hypothetical protein
MAISLIYFIVKKKTDKFQIVSNVFVRIMAKALGRISIVLFVNMCFDKKNS